MPLTLPEIRKNCYKARARMQQARDEKWAFGAFNLDDQATLKAVCLAASKHNAPVLVEVSQGEVDDLGLHNVRDLVDNYKREYKVEMYINLDHSPSVEAAKMGIEAGYEFIHIDISQADHDASDEKIIAATREVVQYAQLTGALVESEPHYFGGSSNVHAEAFDYEEVKKTFSTPEGAQTFVNATGIDTFAAAVGNLHGKYPVPKILDLELLSQLRMAIHSNISLHGGSGTPSHYFRDAVAIGVTKVNINSDMRYAYRTALEQAFKDYPSEYSTAKLIDQYVIDDIQRVVEAKILDFNSAGKAVVD